MSQMMPGSFRCSLIILENADRNYFDGIRYDAEPQMAYVAARISIELFKNRKNNTCLY